LPQVSTRRGGPGPDEQLRGPVAPGDVHSTLRTMILQGDLPPGVELSQPELSRRFSVSRTPLREALRQLEIEGLIVSEGAHRSMRVSPLSMPDLDDLYSMRVTGEALAIWLTVPVLRPQHLDDLEAELDLIDGGDEDAHRRFHAGLRIGGGHRLQVHLDQLFEHSERYHRAFYETPDRAFVAKKLAEHRAILEACCVGDRKLARELIVDHLSTTAIALMTAERYAPFALPSAVDLAKSQSA
jgi:DNA-binding GntR family transcriptional regulator